MNSLRVTVKSSRSVTVIVVLLEELPPKAVADYSKHDYYGGANVLFDVAFWA